MKENQLVLDTEVYKNYFLAKFKAHDGRSKSFPMYNGCVLDRAGLLKILESFEIITFNGRTFDIPILSLALEGASTETLKLTANRIINEDLKYWNFYRQYDLREPKWNHIDLIEVAPGVGVSLKLYGARMNSKKLQDLPIDPEASIAPDEIPIIDSYCGNDLDTTKDLADSIEKRIELRRTMSAQYGLNLLSKSDAQIAEAVIKSEVEKIIGRQIKKVKLTEQRFKYQPPSFIKFKTKPFQDLFNSICETEFVARKGKKTDVVSGNKNYTLTVGDTTYTIGLGGLHSTESEVYHLSDEDNLLIDEDASSFYPSLILQMGMYPEALGSEFLIVYKDITDTRLAAKRRKDKLVADSMKIMINGTYGKLGSQFSIFYAPHLLLQTTLTGQLSLLMIIEIAELMGIPVVSANTDGVLFKCPRSKIEILNKIIAAWENLTGFEMEAAHYDSIYNRDVNNYVAFKSDGEIKRKGSFKASDLEKNPEREICVEAFIAYLKDKVPFEKTIRECKDITKFLMARTVKGGAVKVDVNLEPVKTKKEKRKLIEAFGFVEHEDKSWSHAEYGEEHTIETAYDLLFRKSTMEILNNGEYLGRVVRWYYAKGEKGTINYKTNGNKVPRSEGGKPCMTLPDEFPDDIDYDWYINECNELLMDVGLIRRSHDEKVPRKNSKKWEEHLAKGDIEEDPENPGKYRWTW